jgi:hypothetical protein
LNIRSARRRLMEKGLATDANGPMGGKGKMR